MSVDDKVVIGQTHGTNDPEAVLIGYLLGVEALRAGKQALMWLTKDGVHLATVGYSDAIEIPDAPSIAALHARRLVVMRRIAYVKGCHLVRFEPVAAARLIIRGPPAALIDAETTRSDTPDLPQVIGGWWLLRRSCGRTSGG